MRFVCILVTCILVIMNIIGHQKIRNFFTQAITNDNLAHAYLFTGPKDVGKLAVAKWLVEELLTRHSELGSESKQTLKQVQSDDKRKVDDEFWSKPHPDIFWVKRAGDKKNITIEQLR